MAFWMVAVRSEAGAAVTVMTCFGCQRQTETDTPNLTYCECGLRSWAWDDTLVGIKKARFIKRFEEQGGRLAAWGQRLIA